MSISSVSSVAVQLSSDQEDSLGGWKAAWLKRDYKGKLGWKGRQDKTRQRQSKARNMEAQLVSRGKKTEVGDELTITLKLYKI